MELRKRPRPRRLDPGFVSSPPPPSLPRKRARKLRLDPESVSSPPPPSPPGKRAAEMKRARKLRLDPESVSSPPPPSPPGKRAAEMRYERDIWTEVAKYLHGSDLVRLALTCHSFHRLLFLDEHDSVWCYAFLRDLSLSTDNRKLFVPRPSDSSWRYLYAATFNKSHYHSFRQPDKLIHWLRIAGFLVDTPKLFMTAKLALPPANDGLDISIELSGACLVRNVRPGIWIADVTLVRCAPCNVDGCEGTLQVLDARHCELYLDSKFKDGTLEYEALGCYFSDGSLGAATASIFSYCDINTQHHRKILDAASWMRESSDLLPRACFTPGAVAVGSNLGPNKGLLSRFEAMRDMSGAGEVVSVRITQELC